MSTAFRLHIPATVLNAMRAQVLAELPHECCGLLAGLRETDAARVVQHYPLTNAAASPVRYDADSRDLFRAFRDMRERGLTHLAIYHSHPTSDPVPSRTDWEQAYYPDVMYLILTPAGALRGWWLTGDRFTESPWTEIPAEGNKPRDEYSSPGGISLR